MLKVTKKWGSTLCLKNTFLGKPKEGGEIYGPPTPLPLPALLK